LSGEKEFSMMRHLSPRFTKLVLVGLLTWAAVPANNAVAQEVRNQPRVIGDAKLAACIDLLGQEMVQRGSAQVPVTIKLEAAGETASDQQPKIIGNPVTAACADLLAQNLVRNGAAKLPFVIKLTPAR
jgi:hypothetical protein